MDLKTALGIQLIRCILKGRGDRLAQQPGYEKLLRPPCRPLFRLAFGNIRSPELLHGIPKAAAATYGAHAVVRCSGIQRNGDAITAFKRRWGGLWILLAAEIGIPRRRPHAMFPLPSPLPHLPAEGQTSSQGDGLGHLWPAVGIQGLPLRRPFPLPPIGAAQRPAQGGGMGPRQHLLAPHRHAAPATAILKDHAVTRHKDHAPLHGVSSSFRVPF